MSNEDKLELPMLSKMYADLEVMKAQQSEVNRRLGIFERRFDQLLEMRDEIRSNRESIEDNSKDLAAINDTWTWAIRIVLGAVILAILGVVFGPDVLGAAI